MLTLKIKGWKRLGKVSPAGDKEGDCILVTES